MQGDIELRNVKFRYPARKDAKVFDGLNLSIQVQVGAIANDIFMLEESESCICIKGAAEMNHDVLPTVLVMLQNCCRLDRLWLWLAAAAAARAQ